MEIYKHRHDPKYINNLAERLSLDGPNGIREKAVNISKPWIHDGIEYTKCCRIDFSGISAATLFDLGNTTTNGRIAELVRDLFKSTKKLNKEGIFVKFRILLVYPYSAPALSRIQAESTINRSSIEDPIYPRNLDIVESVDERMFMQSPFVVSQGQMLDQIQELMDIYEWNTKTVNRVYVRFVPTSPNFCLLFINDVAYSDSYLLAKSKRSQRVCAPLGPLVQVDRKVDRESFDAFDDHFRYLWDLDLSIYHPDATFYKHGQPRTLSSLKPPSLINFDAKAAHIKEKTHDLTEEGIVKWKSRAQRLLNRFCIEPAPAPGSEILFITCSWKHDDGQAMPNDYAVMLSEYLESDFGRKRKESLLNVFIMEAAAGGFFSHQLYARLDESTMGLVLLTADIVGADGKYYSKPNVYHELGYLMKQLGGTHVAIVCEQGVTVPSNISDVIRIDFEKDKLLLAYAKIAGWVTRSANIGNSVCDEVEENIRMRLEEDVISGKISSGSVEKRKKELGTF